MLTTVVISILLVLVITGLGVAWILASSPRLSRLEIAAWAYPLGSGLLTFTLFLLSWMGVSLYLKTLMAAYFGLLVVTLVIFYLGRKDLISRFGLMTQKRNGYSAGDFVSVFFIFAFAITAVNYALMRGYSTWDAIGIWSIKGIGIEHEGSIMAGANWGSHGLSYPLNIPLQIAIFRMLGDDLLAGSKLIFPMYYLSLLLGIFAFLKRASGWRIGLLGTMLLSTTPVLFEHATIGYANLPFTTYLVLGLMNIITGVKEKGKYRQILGGLLLGFASWTRPEGAFLIVPILLVLYLGIRTQNHLESSSPTHWVLPPFVMIVLWQVFTMANDSQGLLGEALRSAWTSISGGELNLSAMYWTARHMVGQLIDPSVWGLFVPVGLLLVIYRWGDLFAHKSEALIFLVFPALTSMVSIFAYYYLTSFVQDIQYSLGTSVSRLFMPGWVLLALGVWSQIDPID